MRTVMCRFTDEREFFKRFPHGGSGQKRRAISFLAEFDAKVGEELEIEMVVSSLSERCGLKVRVADRRPVAVDPPLEPASDSARMWNYKTVIEPDERVWFDMFVEKLSMMEKFEMACTAAA